MTKTIHCHWEKKICFKMVWGCAEILPYPLCRVYYEDKKGFEEREK